MKFELENTTLIRYIEEPGDRDIVIPDGVTAINGSWTGSVFSKSNHIESIVIPASVKEIDSYQFYYLKNLRWVEFKGDISIIHENHVFPGCKNMVYVICNPNTPLSQLPSKWKQLLAIGVIKYLYDGNYVNDAVLKEVKKYIKTQLKRLYPIGYEYPFFAKFMVDENLLSEELFDEMIAYTQEERIADVLAILLEGKNSRYPAAALLERMEDKFEKDIAYAQKMDEHTSLTYLKAQWTWKKRADGTLVIWTYKGSDSEVFIPSIIGKNKVTAVRGYLFHSNRGERREWLRLSLNKIHIAEGIVELCCVYDTGNMFETGPLAYFAVPTDIYIPNSVTKIYKDTFRGEYSDPRDYKIRNVTIHAPAGSYAETYAKEHNIPFVAE